ncbi:uncharacterized protein EDB91DRAFT_1082563 [Suillus paluster]|uniref:uncharacterized protein n=1 Tax=Suillus paluster TaxID=48578 RepID=UPI001B876AA7|nr:uncharacterized protein EDB91DRAFT_1082563 [Suillus paluster]KAG1738848.1 hypothetical protein EDB91DRAFT_1082563 [Suillus paluster]
MVTAVHPSPISIMGTDNAPDEIILTRPSSPESGPSTTATLLDVPISPVKTLSIKTFPDACKSASTLLSPTDSFYVSIITFPVMSIEYIQHQYYQVDFHSGEPKNPVNYSWLRKWCITLVVSPATLSFVMGFYAPCSRRGLPVAVFFLVAIVTTGLGSIISGWLELDPHLQWEMDPENSSDIWVFFMSGVLCVQPGSVSAVFKNLYHFNVAEWISAHYRHDAMHRKYVSQRGPEARPCTACVVALLLPTSMFIYAWTADPRIFWMWPVVGLTDRKRSSNDLQVPCSTSPQSAFNIISPHSYGPIASSAFASQGLARNFGSFGFPLFSQTMFDKLTYKWANTIFGGVAVILIPVPFVEEKLGIESRDGGP